MTPPARRSCLLLLTAAGLCLRADAAVLPPVVRGAPSVLIYAQPGPLSVTIHKRDLNIYEGPDELRAYLYDPQRRLLGSIFIPDGGSTGRTGMAEDLQTETLEVTCTMPGVHRLAVVAGGDLIFGMETSAERYVVEGGIMLNDPRIAGTLVFEPPAGAFKITAQALHRPGMQQMPLLDAAGETLHVFDLAEAGQDEVFEVGEDVGHREGLWRFDVARMNIRAQIEGVLYWSAQPDAWFPAHKTRWMLQPYGETRYLRPGEATTCRFTLRNSTGAAARFILSALAEPGLEARIIAPEGSVDLEAGERREITLTIRASDTARVGETYRAHLSAEAPDDPDVVQSAGIEARIGDAPVSLPLDMPIVLERYRHENAQFGYAPDYVTNEVYFDPRNRPFIRNRTEHHYPTTALTLLEEGRWVERPFVAALEEAFPGYRGIYMGGGFMGAKVAFDGDGGAYTLVNVMTADRRRESALLFTPDDGRTYSVHGIPGGAFDIEQFTGHNALDIPPPVLAYRTTAPRPERFASVNDLLLFMPRRENGRLVMGEPVPVSDLCLGSCQHSGGPASTVTRGGKTHIVWGEVTDEDVPGVPTYIATYDHASGALGEKVLLAYAPPVNDVHNVPAVTMDSEGFIHVLSGAHGDMFYHRQSLAPNDAYGAWTEPEEVISPDYVDDNTGPEGWGRGTYISLVCDPDDTLHIAYRQWRRNVDEHHAGQIYAALSVQSKPKGAPWKPAQPIVVPPVAGYSIYYHKLTIDRRGRLWLSYNHFTSDTSYQNEFPERMHHQAVVMSPDGGGTWKLAETRDFVEGLAAEGGP